jgi:hypothetical protein
MGVDGCPGVFLILYPVITATLPHRPGVIATWVRRIHFALRLGQFFWKIFGSALEPSASCWWHAPRGVAALTGFWALSSPGRLPDDRRLRCARWGGWVFMRDWPYCRVLILAQCRRGSVDRHPVGASV